VVVLVAETFQEEPNTTTTPQREFARVVAPLEQAAGRRLGNPHRRVCFEAFRRSPEGVREVARGALADATTNPLGLFFWRIRNHWHELEPLEPPRQPAAATEPEPPSEGALPWSSTKRQVWRSHYEGECAVCQTVRPLDHYRGDRCEECFDREESAA
jgi:hypothetical protein